MPEDKVNNYDSSLVNLEGKLGSFGNSDNKTVVFLKKYNKWLGIGIILLVIIFLALFFSLYKPSKTSSLDKAIKTAKNHGLSLAKEEKYTNVQKILIGTGKDNSPYYVSCVLGSIDIDTSNVVFSDNLLKIYFKGVVNIDSSIGINTYSNKFYDLKFNNVKTNELEFTYSIIKNKNSKNYTVTFVKSESNFKVTSTEDSAYGNVFIESTGYIQQYYNKILQIKYYGLGNQSIDFRNVSFDSILKINRYQIDGTKVINGKTFPIITLYFNLSSPIQNITVLNQDFNLSVDDNPNDDLQMTLYRTSTTTSIMSFHITHYFNFRFIPVAGSGVQIVSNTNNEVDEIHKNFLKYNTGKNSDFSSIGFNNFTIVNLHKIHACSNISGFVSSNGSSEKNISVTIANEQTVTWNDFLAEKQESYGNSYTYDLKITQPINIAPIRYTTGSTPVTCNFMYICTVQVTNVNSTSISNPKTFTSEVISNCGTQSIFVKNLYTRYENAYPPVTSGWWTYFSCLTIHYQTLYDFTADNTNIIVNT